MIEAAKTSVHFSESYMSAEMHPDTKDCYRYFKNSCLQLEKSFLTIPSKISIVGSSTEHTALLLSAKMFIILPDYSNVLHSTINMLRNSKLISL